QGALQRARLFGTEVAPGRFTRRRRQELLDEPVVEVASDDAGEFERARKLCDGMTARMVLEFCLEFREQLGTRWLLVAAFRRHLRFLFEVDEARHRFLPRTVVFGLGDARSVASADDAEVQVAPVDLVERGTASCLVTAAKVLHADELRFPEALEQ